MAPSLRLTFNHFKQIFYDPSFSDRSKLLAMVPALRDLSKAVWAHLDDEKDLQKQLKAANERIEEMENLYEQLAEIMPNDDDEQEIPGGHARMKIDTTAPYHAFAQQLVENFIHTMNDILPEQMYPNVPEAITDYSVPVVVATKCEACGRLHELGSGDYVFTKAENRVLIFCKEGETYSTTIEERVPCILAWAFDPHEVEEDDDFGSAEQD